MNELVFFTFCLEQFFFGTITMNTLFKVLVASLVIGSSGLSYTAQAGIIANGTLSVLDGTLVRTGSDALTKWPEATLTWSVETILASNVDYADFAGNYLYTYRFQVGAGAGNVTPALSHFSLETSATFTLDNILFSDPGEGVPGEVRFESLGFDGSSPKGIDGVDGAELYGLKWDTPGELKDFTVVLISDRDPVWGDVFLKNGTVDAYNAGYFASDPQPFEAPAGGFFNITKYNWLATPNTTSTPPPGPGVVPEPASLAIFGFGALGLGLAQLRRRRNVASTTV